jgi:ribosomal protein L16 Arg81 hydroxylase
MNLRDSVLEWILHPIKEQAFIEKIWENEPCFIQRGDPAYYGEVFKGSDLDHVLEFGRPVPPDMRVILEGNDIPSSEYFQPDGRLDLNQLRRLYADGHTVVLHGLHRFSRPIAEFGQMLQQRLSCKVISNAYLTPRGARGLNPHYDTHDVFILQLAGAKTWYIYGQSATLPLRDAFVPEPCSRDKLPEPQKYELTVGDAMYIPRGWIHDAETEDESSLHLTVGIYSVQWLDLVNTAITALGFEHDDLRRALPLGYLEDKKNSVEAFSRALKGVARLLEQEGVADEVFSMLHNEFIRYGRAAPDGQFIASLDGLSAIDTGTRLIRRPHLSCRVIPVEDQIGLQFSRSIVRGPASYEDAMLFITRARGSFAVAELPSLDGPSKISLAKRLVRDGLLNFANV